MGRLRVLERKLAAERAQLIVEEQVDKYHLQWELAVERGEEPPMFRELLAALRREGFYSPSGARAHGYLRDCYLERRVPDHVEIIRRLLPWYKPP